MAGTAFSEYTHETPAFKKFWDTPAEYLARERIFFIRHLEPDHALRNRVQRHTGAIVTERTKPLSVRGAFTDDELKSLRSKRKAASPDQNEAKLYLKDTNLVNMWNGDYKTDEQWAEYDSVQPTMDEQILYSHRPAEAFAPGFETGFKRKRVSSDGRRVVKLKYEDDPAEELVNLLEDGEIDEKEEEEEDVAQTIELENARLKEENDHMRDFLKSRGPEHNPPDQGSNPPPSPPKSEGTESSDGDSDLDVEVDGTDVGNLKEFGQNAEKHVKQEDWDS